MLAFFAMLMIFMNYVDRVNLAVAAPSIMKELHFTKVEARVPANDILPLLRRLSDTLGHAGGVLRASADRTPLAGVVVTVHLVDRGLPHLRGLGSGPLALRDR